jgi:Tfp pilus assembly protein PilO
MYKTLQQQVQPRMLAILLISLLLLILIAGYLYVIKKPLQSLRQSEQTLYLLENELQTGMPLESQIVSFNKQVLQLEKDLKGTGPQLPVNQMIASVIGQLDNIADHNKVKLISIKPGTTEKIFTFQVLPFHVELSTDYFSLFNWLRELEQELGPILVKKFNLRKESKTNQRRMSLTLVSYQFVEK